MTARQLGFLLSALMSMQVHADGVDDLFDKAARKRGGVNVQVDSSIYRDNDKGVDQARSAAEEVDAVRSRAASASDSQNSSSDSSRPKDSTPKSDSRLWRCKLWCRSSSGSLTQTYREVSAKSRREAANIVIEEAGQICRSDGNASQNQKEFDPGQCKEK